MNETIKVISKVIIDHLPQIFTGVAMVSAIGTGCYALYAGHQLAEKEEEISKETTITGKAKIVTPVVAPVFVGTVITCGAIILVNREYAKRYGLAVAAIAASQANNTSLKDSIQSTISKKDDTKIVEPISINKSEYYKFRDLETGYEFVTTMINFEETRDWFNQEAVLLGNAGETIGMDEFYEKLLGNAYLGYSIHSSMRIGCSNEINGERIALFMPQFNVEIHGNNIVYAFGYDYIEK